MTAITGPVAWICSPATGEITGYRRKVNGVYKDFPFPLPNAAMSLADAVLVPQPLWITNSTTGAIEGYRRAIGNLDVDYNAYPGAGTAAGRVTLGVQWLANIATGEIIGYRTTNADGSITDRSVAFGATLLLDFTNTSTLDPRITFTRSTTATFTGSNGLLQTAAINAPRFDYAPVTLAPLGLLIEEQRTNLLTYSEMFADAAWTKTNASVTANTIVSPDGALTGDKLVENTANGFHLAQSATITPTASTLYTFTCYAKAAERTQVSVAFTGGGSADSGVIFDLLNGAYVATIGVAPNSYNIISVGDGWYRCSITWATTNTNVIAGRVYCALSSAISYTGDGTSGIFIWGAQVEAGAFPTSYIPTVASQVTRAADVAVMTGTNFSSWYNQAEGTLYVEAALVSNSGNRVYLDVGPNGAFGTTAYIIQTSSAISLAPAAAPVNMASSVNTTSLNNKVAAALETNNSLVAANGALGTVDTNCAMPVSATQLVIGNAVWSGGGTQLNGYICKIAYYPRRLSNAALQGITS